MIHFISRYTQKQLAIKLTWLLPHWTCISIIGQHVRFNSLAPGGFQRNFSEVIFQLILLIDGWSISCKIALEWMTMDLTDGKSTLVQVMAWCRQATSHYLSQCWPRSLSPYGVIRPHWVNRDKLCWMIHNTTHLTGWILWFYAGLMLSYVFVLHRENIHQSTYDSRQEKDPIQNLHNKHRIPRPWGEDLWCLLGVHTLINS